MVDWTNTENNNKVYLDIERADNAMKQLESGIINAVYISGPAGVGKTRIVQNMVKRFVRKGREPISIGTANKWQDLRTALATSGGWRPVIIDDEESALFSSTHRLNLLKVATGIGNNLHGGVFIKAPVIVTTNADLSPSSFSARKQEHIPALWGAAGRGVLIDINRDRGALWEYTCHLALSHNLIRTVQGAQGRQTNVPINLAFDALEWFTEHSHRIEQLTPRTLQNIARNFAHGSGRVLDADLQSLLSSKVLGARLPAQRWLQAWEQANGKPLNTKQALHLPSDRMDAAAHQQQIAALIAGAADQVTAHD